ncbi:hypothetical protein Bhyg_10836 [Pseudolycoriella hygida]|uniref:Uncharacterized protein n=1 Tax=Pseudolycoriella hygida TaxID=35572 RepID=A0A9Q0RZP6_9DIPT|nr:hypothetical protein Bhyg_10836 [Pseudolycoriella hygida]
MMTEIESKDIFVQAMPIIKCKASKRILLCKWIKGDYKDRYTGLISPVNFKENEANFREKLEKSAVSLLPANLSSNLVNVELVAILNFTDPPAYTEYVYMTYLSEDSDAINDTVFDENPCHWFHWENIPFQEMPEDDHLWYPKVLEQGLKVTGSFTFGSWSEKTLKCYKIEEMPQL